ncbi:unnamed protein product [Brassica napus]|nr:unnamed protein product [Brassica napus]
MSSVHGSVHGSSHDSPRTGQHADMCTRISMSIWTVSPRKGQHADMIKASPATDRAQVPPKGAPERVRAPSCPDPVAPRGAVYESGCLGMQPQSGGKFRPRLNMGERPIANKYRECLKLSGGKRMGAGDASWSDAERSNPSADRFGATRHGVPRHLRAQGVGLPAGPPIRPVLKHGPRSLTCVRVNG